MSQVRSGWFQAICLWVVVVCPCLPQRAQADDEPAQAIPFIVVTVASADKTLSDIGWMFDSIQRPDMKDVVGGLLGQISDLQGFDRTAPFGQGIFLQTDTLPPRPAFVVFAPIADVNALMETVNKLPVRIRKAADRDDQLELLPPDEGGDVVSVIRVVGNYAYAVPEEQADILDVLPDLQPLARRLASQYDAALTVQVKAIPLGVRQVFINFLRAQAEIDLQRRDDEDEAAYLVRRSNGLSTLEFIEQVAMQGEDLTLGWNSEPEKHSGYFDAILNASPNSELAKYLTEVSGKTSMFQPLRDEDRPFTLNISWAMNAREKKAGSGLVQALQAALSKELPDMAVAGGPIELIHEVLQATVDGGHFDAYLQFAATGEQSFVLTGALRLVGAQTFGKAAEQLLQGVILKIQEGLQTNPGGVADAPTIVLNAESHQGISFHKISPRQVRSNEERLYGGTPDLYVGSSSRAVWFAVGGTDALPTLKSSIDRLNETPPAERTAGGNVPVSLTLRVAPWLELPQPEPDEVPQSQEATTQPPTAEAGRRQRRAQNAGRAVRGRLQMRKLAEQAFTPTDGIRIEVRTTESGMRTRITLDEGFVRMLGLAITREYDRSQL